MRVDPRVRVMERTNLRSLRLPDLGCPPLDIVTLDLSFISVIKMVDTVGGWCWPGCLGGWMGERVGGLEGGCKPLKLWLRPSERPDLQLSVLNKPGPPPPLPACRAQVCDVLAPGGELVVLIKPQFEAGKEQVGGWVGHSRLGEACDEWGVCVPHEPPPHPASTDRTPPGQAHMLRAW